MIDRRKAYVIWIAVVLLSVAGLGYYIADNFGHKAQFSINIHSIYDPGEVSVDVYLIPDRWSFEDMEPGEVRNISYEFRFSLFESEKNVSVMALSNGGIQGPKIDRQIIVIENKGSYVVDLYI